MERPAKRASRVGDEAKLERRLGCQETLNDETRFWREAYGRELGLDEVEEIRRNTVHFFGVLMRIDARLKDSVPEKTVVGEGRVREERPTVEEDLGALGRGANHDG